MVSRVLNNSGAVAAHKRRRIRQILEKRDYQPSQAARALGSKQTRTVGVVVREIAQNYYQLVASPVLAGIAEWCRDRSRYVAMVWEDEGDIETSVRDVVGQVDGLILLDVSVSDDLRLSGR